ncbi:MAG TPA: phospholipase D-like domain-containing protein [Gaiella sp.]|nr:phospholipase D-like domain-containing protein [Gaiella sp.]
MNTPTGQVGPPESAHARRAQPGAAIELTTLTDGGQPAPQIAAEIATFLNHARTSLDLALYDVRLETEAGALVLATLLAAHQRGLRVRLLYNVDHPGPIPVPPPPETRPEAIEALPVETRGIAGIPDLMHHKFCVRDRRDVWTGSMNWTEDSWTRQENVVVRVLGAERLAFAFSLAFEELWQRGAVEGTGTVEPRPVELPDGSSVRPWFTPGHGEALSHRVAKHIGRARRRIRIASPVLTAGPILGTLVEVVNERRCTVVGVVDDTQVDDVFRQWSRNQVSAWKIPLLHTIVERGAFSGKPSTPWAPDGIQDFMHAKVVVCDDVSFVGSFNFSRSGERNAENVVEIHDAATADALARYVEDVKERYPQATPPDVRADAGELAAVDVRQPVDNAGP